MELFGSKGKDSIFDKRLYLYTAIRDVFDVCSNNCNNYFPVFDDTTETAMIRYGFNI